ncbi:MAG: hypothetical protein IT236_15235 [Bacteroidia bacterium]|nr:hypothetical protein [Bacteroidia bacterium]
MTKNILIPIDFCVASLNTLKLVLESNKAQKISVILVHAEYLSDSEMDLLFYSPYNIIDKNLTVEFKEALEILKNRYSTLEGIFIKLFHGNNLNYMQNFLSANKIEEIYLPKTYQLKQAKRTFNSVTLFKRSSLPVFEMDWEQHLNETEQEHLSALFNRSL